MTKTLEHEVKPPDSLYWANVLRDRDVIKGQLDAMEETLAAKDDRIVELERAVHERAKSLAERTRQVAQLQDDLCDARYARDKAQSELAALKSAPRYVQAAVETMLGYHVAEWQDLLSWVELHSNPLFGEKVGLVELAKRAAHGYVASALKSAPVRFEREVDAELRAALKACCEWTRPGTRILHALDRWLAAPLSAEDEYTRAAVAYAEGMLDEDVDADDFRPICDKWKALWNARHSAAASAPDGEKAAPAPADGERVTVYVMIDEHGVLESELYMERDRKGMNIPGAKWLALDARVVREGGAS